MTKIIRGHMASLTFRPRRFGFFCIPFVLTFTLITWLTFVSVYIKPEEALIERHRTNRQIFNEIASLEVSTIKHEDIEDVQVKRLQNIKDYCR